MTINYNQIAALIHANQLKEAMVLCESACRQTPVNPQAWFLKGSIHSRIGEYVQAEQCYRMVFSTNTEHPAAYFNLGCALYQQGKTEQAAAAWNRAVQLKPDFFDAHIALGKLLVQLDRQLEGINSFKQALQARPGDLEGSKLLHTAYDRIVERWHFPMLNDEGRNETYNRAIQRIVKQDSVVLDIGTGSGLLAMMAARAGAKHVYACEATPLVAEKAREIIALNGFSDRITVFGKKSSELAIGIDLPAKADVVVSEIVDVGLLAEGILPSMQHARQHLAKEQACFIPRNATVYGMLIESPELQQTNYVSTASGFDVSPFNEFSSIAYQQKLLKQHAFRALSEPFEMFKFDLTGHPPGRREKQIAIPTVAGGTCNAVVFWFRLFLDETDLFIDTGPEGSTCWMQAVQLFPTPAILSADQQATLHVWHDNTQIRCVGVAAQGSPQ